MGNRATTTNGRHELRIAVWREKLEQTPPSLPYKLPNANFNTLSTCSKTKVVRKRNAHAQQRQQQKISSQSRSLPSELLYEITKWIPLRIEQHRNIGAEIAKQVAAFRAATDRPFFIERIPKMVKKRIPTGIKAKWQKLRRHNKKPRVLPLNAEMLETSSKFSQFLHLRCIQLSQMVAMLFTDYSYVDCPDDNDYILIKKKKNVDNKNDVDGTNISKILTAPISMLEMLRHICFGQLYWPKSVEKEYIFGEQFETMPTDFQPVTFLECFMQFTKWTPNPGTVNKFKIYLTEEQCREMENEMKMRGVKNLQSRDAEIIHLGWLNAHFPGDREFHLELYKREMNEKFPYFLSITFVEYGMDVF